MKSSFILLGLSLAFLATANPLGSALLPVDFRSGLKRTNAPGGCSPSKQDFYLNNVNVNSPITMQIIGNNLQCSFPAIAGEIYEAVHLNIAPSLPGPNDDLTPSLFNLNSYCSLINGGASALCSVPLTPIPGDQCGPTDFFMGAHAVFAGSNDGWSVGCCYNPSCLISDGTSDWEIFSKGRFDCSGTGGGQTTSTLTETSTLLSTVTKISTVLITSKSKSFYTTTEAQAGKTKAVTSTSTATIVQIITQPTTVIITDIAKTTATTTIGAPISSVTACPVSTAYCSSDTASALSAAFETLTNLFTSTTIDLLTSTYKILTIQNAGGNLVRMDTVLIKLQPDNTLLVDANADADYDLVSVGVSGNCNLLGLTNGGIELYTCSTSSLCQTLPGLFDTYSSQVLDLSKSLGLTCGVSELQFEIQAVVRKLTYVGTSC